MKALMAVNSDPRQLALRRRLADGPRTRWLWALGSGLPGIGLVVVLAHGITRRTLTPALFGITAIAAAGFALGSYRGIQHSPSEAAARPGGAQAALFLAAAVAVFAFGHKHGQDRAAAEALKWLELER
jgi:drug/metabolite transporter (DMT)-like permease